jgi:hypothetical protein
MQTTVDTTAPPHLPCLRVFVVVIATSLASCHPSDGLDHADASAQIAHFFAQYPCANYLTVGKPEIKDVMLNAPPEPLLFGVPQANGAGPTSEAVVEAATPLAKTKQYAQSIEHGGLFFALAPCSDDWLSPSGRFRNLAAMYAQTPIGTPIEYWENYRFQKWESGWRLVGVDPTTPVSTPASSQTATR